MSSRDESNSTRRHRLHIDERAIAILISLQHRPRSPRSREGLFSQINMPRATESIAAKLRRCDQYAKERVEASRDQEMEELRERIRALRGPMRRPSEMLIADLLRAVTVHLYGAMRDMDIARSAAQHLTTRGFRSGDVTDRSGALIEAQSCLQRAFDQWREVEDEHRRMR